MSTWRLVSWTTYATWLPGDPRGYCTRRAKQYIPPPKRYAQPGERTYQPGQYRLVHQRAQSDADESVCFTRSEMDIALGTMVETIAELPIVPAIISLGEWHVHWLCHFGTLKIRWTVGRVKAAATRELNARGFRGKRPWTKGCHIKSKSTPREFRNAYKYVQGHEDQGCLIHEWNVARDGASVR